MSAFREKAFFFLLGAIALFLAEAFLPVSMTERIADGRATVREYANPDEVFALFRSEPIGTLVVQTSTGGLLEMELTKARWRGDSVALDWNLRSLETTRTARFSPRAVQTWDEYGNVGKIVFFEINGFGIPPGGK